MIYELRIYTLLPGRTGDWLKLAGEHAVRVRGDNYGKLEGYWQTEFGTLNQIYHLWSYSDLNERARLREALWKLPAWLNDYVAKARPLMLTQENKILLPLLQLKAPAEPGNLYELRSYRMEPGRVGEWSDLFKKHLAIREKYSKIVGLWQTEMGGLNEVTHIWAYKDLNQRMAARAAVAQDAEWQGFIGQGRPFLRHMTSTLLVPAPFSPLR